MLPENLPCPGTDGVHRDFFVACFDIAEDHILRGNAPRYKRRLALEPWTTGKSAHLRTDAARFRGFVLDRIGTEQRANRIPDSRNIGRVIVCLGPVVDACSAGTVSRDCVPFLS